MEKPGGFFDGKLPRIRIAQKLQNATILRTTAPIFFLLVSLADYL